MERDETIARLTAITQEPLQMLARELKAIAAELNDAERKAVQEAAEATSVAKMHAALLQAAQHKGARIALGSVADAIHAAVAKRAPPPASTRRSATGRSWLTT